MLLPACAPKPPAATRGDGTLVLELGGGYPSLRAALTGLGVELEAPRQWRPTASTEAPAAAATAANPAAAATPAPQPPAAIEALLVPDPGAGPALPDPVPSGQEWVEVALEPRQTLMHLARIHLGSGNRFKEIMAWNGWTDADARRLQPGTKVRLRKDALRR